MWGKSIKNISHLKIERRKSIKQLLLISGVSGTLPNQWIRPFVDSVTLPSHAQSTPPPPETEPPLPDVVECTTSPSTLDFSDVQHDSIATEQITITNSGTIPLQVDDVSSDNSDFSPQLAGPVVVQPNSSINVNIDYSCSVPGSDTGRLTVSASGNQQQVSCDVSLQADCQLSNSCGPVDTIPGFSFSCGSIPTPRNIVYDIDDSSGCPILITNAASSSTSGFRWQVLSEAFAQNVYEFIISQPSSNQSSGLIYRRNCSSNTGQNSIGLVRRFFASPSGIVYELSFTVTTTGSGTSSNHEITISDATITPA